MNSLFFATKTPLLSLLFLARVVEGDVWPHGYEVGDPGTRCSSSELMINDGMSDAGECTAALLALKNIATTHIDIRGLSCLGVNDTYACGCSFSAAGSLPGGSNPDVGSYVYECVLGEEGARFESSAMPICRVSPPAPSPPAANGGGDPHYSMFSKQLVTVQALCDLNLFSLKNAYGGVQIHSRHSMPLLKKEKNKGYSIISNLAIRIGNDTWELIAEGPKLYKNGIYFDGFEDFSHEEQGSPILKTSFGPAGTYDAKEQDGSTHYSAQKYVKGQRKNIVEYVFTFPDNLSNKVVFRGNRHYRMNFVEVHGFASHSVQGFLGRTDKHGFFDRRGKDMMSKEESYLRRNKDTRFSIELFAQEWQVGLDEPNLFMNESNYPVAPQKCSFLGKGSIDGLVDSDIVDAGNDLTIMGEEARPRRKLFEVDEEVVLMATEACEHLSDDNPKKKFCLKDVMVTEEPELALDSFYEE